MPTRILLNEEMVDIMKIVKSLEKLCLLIKGITKIVQNEKKEQKLEFTWMKLYLMTFIQKMVFLKDRMGHM